MTSSRRRLQHYGATFRPYFGQFHEQERDNIKKRIEPQKVCFSWAVRHEVVYRATQEDVEEGWANYVGEAIHFDSNKQLAPPRLTFNSGRSYCNWREGQSDICGIRLQHTPKGVLPPEELDDVPDWMLDLEAEYKFR
tara:strand:- start:485 stop:895 length:411 start_codon:yes stop_codon:yes gene_type:complete